MKLYLLIMLSITELFALSVEQISIANKPFSIVTEHYNEYGTKGEFIILYAGVEQNKSSELLNFILSQVSGSCSDKKIEKGIYEINASTITFYSSWSRQGQMYHAPKGARVQIYNVLEDGSLKKVSSQLYIETSRKNYDEESAMKYLFTVPKTESEKEALQAYVDEVEKRYHGTFLFGEEARKLMLEVKEAFGRKIKASWGGNG